MGRRLILCVSGLFEEQPRFEAGSDPEVNSDSGTSRKIQRTAAGGSKIFGHVKGDDDAYADVLLAGKDSDATAGAAAGVKFDLGLPAGLVAAQKKKGSQSLRSTPKNYGPMISKDKHGSKCFDEMLKNEQERSAS